MFIIFFEIYKICTSLHRSKVNVLQKTSIFVGDFLWTFHAILNQFSDYSGKFVDCRTNLMLFSLNFMKLFGIHQNLQRFAETCENSCENLGETIRMHGSFWYHPSVGVDFAAKFRSAYADGSRLPQRWLPLDRSPAGLQPSSASAHFPLYVTKVGITLN